MSTLSYIEKQRHYFANKGPPNQGKLEVVKQKMARVNIDILGINELKWTGMGEDRFAEEY